MKFSKSIRNFCLSLLIALSVAFAPPVSHAAKGKITIWEQDWTGNLVNNYLVGIILEEHMDYKVKYTFMSGTAGWEAMSAGDLDLDLKLGRATTPMLKPDILLTTGEMDRYYM